MAFRDHERPGRRGEADFLVDLRPLPFRVTRHRVLRSASLILFNESTTAPYRVRVAKNRHGNGADHPAIHDLLADLPSLVVDGDIIVVPSDKDLVLLKLLTA